MAEITTRNKDVDSTDELPVLSEAEIVSVGAPAAGAPEPEGEPTVSVPFPKLERRREFGQRMASLESRIDARDAAVGELDRRIDEIARGWRSIEAELSRNAAAIESLAAELTARHGGPATARDAGRPAADETGEPTRDDVAAELAEAETRRLDAERARAEAEAELEKLRETLSEREHELEQSRTRLGELEAANTQAEFGAGARRGEDLRGELAALRDYVTNRRAHWDELEARVAEQARRIRELELELEQRVAREHAAEALAERESLRASEYRDELARRAAGLPPRDALPHAAAEPAVERESEPGAEADEAARDGTQHGAAARDAAARTALEALEHELVELRGTLDAQSAQLHAAAAEDAEAASEREDPVHDRLAAAEGELDQARADLQRLERALIERERAAEQQSARIAALQDELSSRVDRRRDAGDAAEAPAEAPAEPRARVTRSIAPEAAEAPELGALVCLTSDRPEHYPISRRVMLIGRNAECDIRIATHFVSREHARLRNDGRSVYIDDLGSTNGVFVNSIRVDNHELHDGDWVTIGETQFRYIAARTSRDVS